MDPNPEALYIDHLALGVIRALQTRSEIPSLRTLAVVESHTGGLISAALSGVEGSEEVLTRAYVAYTAKVLATLGIPKILLDEKVWADPVVTERLARNLTLREYGGAEVGLAVLGNPQPGPSRTVRMVAYHRGSQEVFSLYGEDPPGTPRNTSVANALELLGTLLGKDAEDRAGRR
jgi:nicotinamide-nucleotide amidase